MPSKIVTLTTDFGLKDPYVAEMKAVILDTSPKTTIVDISHQIEKFNMRMGAYVLASVAQYFPKGTIHVAVIDPSVGTERHQILIETNYECFVGPDNDVLVLAAEKQGIRHIYKITNGKLMRLKISCTFHGRDIFAPAAAYLARGELPKEFEPEIYKILTPDFAKIINTRDKLVGEVVHIDDFGNVITNFGEKELKYMKVRDTVNVELKNLKIKLKVCKSYAEVAPKKPLAIIGSHDFLEISISQGNAAETFKIRSGDKITLYYAKE